MASLTESACATKERIEQLKSPILVGSYVVLTGLTFSTFIISYYAMKKVIIESIFHTSTKVLLIFNLFYANCHQLSYFCVSVMYIYRSFFLIKYPCKLIFEPGLCDPITFLLVVGIGGMVYIQSGLLFERLLATFIPNYSSKSKYYSGTVIGVLTLCVSVPGFSIVTWGDPLNLYQFSCFHWPAASSDRANVFIAVLVVLSVVNISAIGFLLGYSKSLEFRIRFKVQGRFEKREAIVSTVTICDLTFVQFICMFLYSAGILSLRLAREKIPLHIYNVLNVWFYTVPVAAFSCPIVMIHCINKIRQNRHDAIKHITKQQETQSDHMERMKEAWG